jgi:hypothetical protein
MMGQAGRATGAVRRMGLVPFGQGLRIEGAEKKPLLRQSFRRAFQALVGKRSNFIKL